MKILLIHRYFKPDKTPCSYILYEIASFLGKVHNVDVLSSLPSYGSGIEINKKIRNENLENINIERIYLSPENNVFYLRLLNAFKLSFFIIKKTLKKKYDIIIVTTTPPILCSFVVSILTKLLKKRMIYYCMDINPEISLVLNDLKKKFLYKFFMFIENITCKIANPILVHSNDMLKTLRKRKNGKKYNIKILNNFATGDKIDNKKKININSILKKKKVFLNNKNLKIIYAGNIGRFQDLDTIFKGMLKLPNNSKVEMLVMGEGMKKKYFLDFATKNNLNIKFLDYQTPKIAKSIISKADLGIVTLNKNMYKYAYPSKISTYLQQGIPIICPLEKDSQIAADMKSMKYGFWTPRKDSKKLAQLLVKLSSKKSWRIEMKKNAIIGFNKKFSSSKILDDWQDIIHHA